MFAAFQQRGETGHIESAFRLAGPMAALAIALQDGRDLAGEADRGIIGQCETRAREENESAQRGRDGTPCRPCVRILYGRRAANCAFRTARSAVPTRR